jgi:hypothetical protein
MSHQGREASDRLTIALISMASPTMCRESGIEQKAKSSNLVLLGSVPLGPDQCSVTLITTTGSRWMVEDLDQQLVN